MKKYGFHLGVFWNSLLRGSHKKLFEEYRKKSSNMEDAYQEYLNNKGNKKTPEEKIKSKT